MRAILRSPLIHPLLLSAWPVLLFYARNASQFPPGVMFRPAAMTVGLAAAMTLLAGAILRNYRKAAVLVSLFVVLLFAFQSVEELLVWLDIPLPRRGMFPTKKASLAILTLAFVGGAFMTLRPRHSLGRLTRAMNLAAACLVAFSTGMIMVDSVRGRDSRARAMAPMPPIPSGAARLPDVYFVVLDSYDRCDVMQEYMQLDNRVMCDALRSRGFWVAPGCRSNYAVTGLSLASCLNMNYLDDLIRQHQSGARSRASLHQLIDESALWQYLRQAGYRRVSFATGYPLTEIPGDPHVGPSEIPNEFEYGLLCTTPLPKALFCLVPHIRYDKHRNGIRFVLEHLSDYAGGQRPMFVFAHLVSPHPPFVFGPGGQALDPEGPYTMANFTGPRGVPYEDYLQGYRSQVQYLNSVFPSVIDRILQRSTTPPVIVLMGDHGSASTFQFQDPPTLTQRMMQERLSPMSAVLLPGGPHGLPEDLTHVNIFRLVINRCFGGNMPLLPNRNYYSHWQQPFVVTDVTAILSHPAATQAATTQGSTN